MQRLAVRSYMSSQKPDHASAPRHSSPNLTELRTTLLAQFRSPTYKPPVLPAVALKLTHLARKPNVSYEELVQIVEQDPLLVASVLKLAQSPIYGGRARVKSLKDALQRLGINNLRDITWQVVVSMRIFRSSSYSSLMERLQRHSVFTGYVARLIAGHASIPVDYAFLCGLLHDVGWSGALIVAADSLSSAPRLDDLFKAIDRIHTEAGQSMATLWGLAPEIVSVIGNHHGAETSTPLPSMVSVLCIAEQLADELDYGLEPTAAEDAQRLGIDENLVGRYEQAVQTLLLTPKLEQLREEAGQIAERLRLTETA
jgi:putative nucleotidyltransferase with HDIG domain